MISDATVFAPSWSMRGTDLDIDAPLQSRAWVSHGREWGCNQNWSATDDDRRVFVPERYLAQKVSDYRVRQKWHPLHQPIDYESRFLMRTQTVSGQGTAWRGNSVMRRIA